MELKELNWLRKKKGELVEVEWLGEKPITNHPLIGAGAIEGAAFNSIKPTPFLLPKEQEEKELFWFRHLAELKYIITV